MDISILNKIKTESQEIEDYLNSIYNIILFNFILMYIEYHTVNLHKD